jgi:hypothetical protein
VRAEEYKEEQLELEGWPVNLVSYKLGDRYICEADNVSPGAKLARISALSPQEARAQAIERARRLLARTRRMPV